MGVMGRRRGRRLAPPEAGASKPVSTCAFRLRVSSSGRGAWIRVIALVLLPALAVCARAQGADVKKDGIDASLLAIPPRSWVVDAAANELVALHHKGSYLRYRMESVNEKGSQVR